VPGVLSDVSCFQDESHYSGLLEYPQYSRPLVWEGRGVPEVLVGGNHGKIARWRRKEALRRTRDRRPDMLERFPLTGEDRELLRELENELPPSEA
jgi:tRNA (guanine37-N1)-methyltransferase